MSTISRLESSWPAELSYLAGLEPLINLAQDEGMILFNLARQARYAIVEIGSFKGRSSCFLAAGSKRGHGVKVYCIDTWDLRPPYFDHGLGARCDVFASPDVRKDFDAQTKPYADIIVPMKGYSTRMATVWARPIGLLYIDGDHGAAWADYLAWGRYLRRGTILAMHDIDMALVKKACDKIMQTRHFTPWKTVNRLAWAIRK